MIRSVALSLLVILPLSGCGASSMKMPSSTPNSATQQIKSPELKHMLDYHKQKRQIEEDMQIRVRQEEIHPSPPKQDGKGAEQPGAASSSKPSPSRSPGPADKSSSSSS